VGLRTRRSGAATLRTKAEFSSRLPDDAIEDEHDFVVLPGRNVAEALRELLAELDCEVKPVADAGDHGWMFDARRGDVEFYCELTIIGGVVAQFVEMSFRAPTAAFAELLIELSYVLQADARFYQLGWFTAEEVTLGCMGASSPTGVYNPEPCQRSIGPRAEPDECAPAPKKRKPEPPPGVPTGWSDLQPHPLRRWIARMFDFYLVTAVVLAGFAQVFLRGKASPQQVDLLWLLPVRIPLSILANALLLAGLSTTPGKWLCGVKVVRADGGRVSFAQAIRREAAVALAGCWLYLPGGVSLIPMGISGYMLLVEDTTSWDRRRGLVAVQRLDSWVQGLLTFAAFVGLAGLYVWSIV